MRRRYDVLTAVLVVLAATMGGLAVSATQAQDSCGQSVTHSFRTTVAIDAWNGSQSVASSEQNTDVTVSESTGFVRVAASNPNAYCVAYTVEIPPEIVRPADLGTVSSVNGTVEAQWQAIQNYSSGAEFTRVTFTLSQGTSVEFAPNKARVVSLAWATKARDTGQSILDTLSGFALGDENLERRHYTIEGQAGNRRVIPLTAPNGSGEVTNWQAEFRTPGGDWQPLGTETDAAVYYTKPSPDQVRLHFTEDAIVSWTANPSLTEKINHQMDGYAAGWEGLGGLLESLPF